MNDSKKDIDVTIAGGGITGLCAALAFGQRGLNVCLVPGRPLTMAPADDGRAFALSASTLNLFEHLGLASVIYQTGQPMWDIVVSSGFWPSCHFIFSHERDLYGTSDQPLGYLVEAYHLFNALRDGVHQCDAITIAREVPKSSLLVIAEGKNSSLAHKHGVTYFEHAYNQIAFVGTLNHTRDHEGKAHECFFPTGPFALLPMTQNRTSFVWVEKAHVARKLLSGNLSTLKAVLAHRVGACLGAYTLKQDQLWHYPLHLKLATRLVGEGFCLVGDSAHVIHPLAGQGLNLGLRDVSALVDVIIEAHQLGLDIGSSIVLEKYENWRWTDIAFFAACTHGLNMLFSQKFFWLRPIQTLGLAFFDRLPFIKRHIVGAASGLQGDLPTLARPKVSLPGKVDGANASRQVECPSY